MDEFTKEEYENAILKKEETRKQLLEVGVQMELSKFYEEELNRLKLEEKELTNIIKKCIHIIITYEKENNIERRKK